MGKVALITGAGRGIGRATARLAAEKGYDVLINYLHEKDAAAETAGSCAELGVRTAVFAADVAEPEAVARMFAHCEATLGRPSLLVNNAGIIGRAGRLEDLDDDALQRTFAVNVLGAITCCRHAIAAMSRDRGGDGGVIVNISSIAAVLGSPGEYVHYAASKAALETLTIGLAKEVGPQGIRVNAVRAGTTDTDIHVRSGNPDRPGIVARTAPLRRTALPRDIAEAVVWLASDAASFVTGAVLNVSGGL
ncbi:MAG: SDR family oxidoreductase [Hyphomicrobiaceae bacterium]|nr:SDR family oxidoreductase [Hyphomicrobiaceae bacterium]